MESLNDFATVLSLALTVVFLLFFKRLGSLWGSSFKQALAQIGYWKIWRPIINTEVWLPSQWLAVGILSGFAANALDNLYWGVTWTLDYYQHENAAFLFTNGPTSNVFFRQWGGIWAVYCHLVAAAEIATQARDIAKVDIEKAGRLGESWWYWVAGLIVFLILVFTG